jgi:hypothetical protein
VKYNNKYCVFILQVNSRSLRLGANRRTEVTEEFRKASPIILQLLVRHCHVRIRVQSLLESVRIKVRGYWSLRIKVRDYWGRTQLSIE